MSASRWADLGLKESQNICDDFRPLSLLGAGTFGTVWAAVPCRPQSPKGSGKHVAVKFIHVVSLSKQVLDLGGSLGRELAVIKVLAATPHVNIVQSFGALYDRSIRGESEVAQKLLTREKRKECTGLVGIPMEMADFSLRSWLRRRGQDLGSNQCARFDLDMVPRCAADICEGVAHMHRLGLMHRDLKPDNVIVFLSPGCGPTLKIADFGSARAYKHICDALPLADVNSSLSTDVCTYWYAAVELLLGDHEYSEKVDIWSIRCIVGELMIGSPLFVGEGPKHVVKAIQQQLGLIEEGNCPSARRAQGKTILLKCNQGQSFANQAIAPDHPEWDAFFASCLCYDPAQRPCVPTARAKVPTGTGTCAVTRDSQAQTSLAGAFSPSCAKRRRLRGKAERPHIADAIAGASQLWKLHGAISCECSGNCGTSAHAPRWQRCNHLATAGALEKPLCKHCVCLVDGCNAPRNKSCCCLRI